MMERAAEAEVVAFELKRLVQPPLTSVHLLHSGHGHHQLHHALQGKLVVPVEVVRALRGGHGGPQLALRAGFHRRESGLR